MAPLTLARAQLPSLGDGGEMSLGAERRLGDSIAREIYRDLDYVDDPVLAEYVQQVWRPLLAAARQTGDLSPDLDERFAWEVMLVRDRSVNAFALPGGYLGVHLGLISAVSSPDELASVLAHELTHVTQRHISRQMSKQAQQSPLMVGAMILGILAASKSPNAANALITGGQAVAIQAQLNFSRDMEREADRVGYGVMTQAGFEPAGFVGMFEKLQQASRLNDNGSYPYLRSHPMTTERIADAQARQQLGVKSAPPALSVTHAMMAARARVLSGPTRDQLRAWVTEVASPEFANAPPARQAGQLYTAILAKSQLKEPVGTDALVRRLTVLVRDDAAASRLTTLLAAEAALAAGDARRADLLTDPASLQRPEVLLSARAQIQTGQAREAAQKLQSWVANHPRDAMAWQSLSDAWGASGQAVRAIRADGEVRVVWMDYAAAIDRFRAAQDLVRRGGAVDHIEASVVDSRLREVQLLLREQALQR